MHGTRVVDTLIYRELSGLTAAAAFTGKLVRGQVKPQFIKLPALTFYPTFTAYADPMGNDTANQGAIAYEQLRYAIVAITDDLSADTIAPVMDAAQAHFHRQSWTETTGGIVAFVTFVALSEVLPLTVNDVATGAEYQQLGTVYSVELTTGG